MKNKIIVPFENQLEVFDYLQKASVANMNEALKDLPEDEKKEKKNEILKKELRYDALADAEKITGVSYKDSSYGKNTTYLGMLKMLESNARKEEILKERKDTIFSSTVEYYIDIIEANGFSKILELPFHSDRWDLDEKMFVYWHPDGILLRFDTFKGNINSSTAYYNWETTKKDRPYSITSTYSPIEYRDEDEYYLCIKGNHDGREALIYNLNQLREYGSFLKIWKERPFIWLLNFADTEKKPYDYEKINEERIAFFPKEIQDAIKGDG